MQTLATIALTIFAFSQALSQEPVFDPVTETVFYVPQPSFSHINSVSSTIAGNMRNVSVQMNDSISLTNDAMIVMAHFSDGTSLVFCLGTAEVPNIPIQPGEVVLIRTQDRTALETGSGYVIGNTVNMSVSYPAPPNTFLDTVECKYIDASTIAVHGMATIDQVFGSFRHLNNPPAMSASVLLFSGSVGGQQPPRTRFPMNTDPRWRVPTPIGVPKPGDVTGDGTSDWDTNSDTRLGNSLIYIDGWVQDNSPEGASDNDMLIVVIGHDNNQNGKLEPNEITNIIWKMYFCPRQEHCLL